MIQVDRLDGAQSFPAQQLGCQLPAAPRGPARDAEGMPIGITINGIVAMTRAAEQHYYHPFWERGGFRGSNGFGRLALCKNCFRVPYRLYN